MTAAAHAQRKADRRAADLERKAAQRQQRKTKDNT